MTEPTDDELWQLHMQMPGVHKDPIDFARAVLAKWGTPTHTYAEPYGCVTSHRVTGQQFFYRYPEPPYLDNASECVMVYTAPQLQSMTPPPIECDTEELKRAYAFGWWSALEKQRETVQAGAVPLTCEWTHNADDDCWDTECGRSWRFDDGGPKENHMNFCHCCGKTLRIKGGQHGTS